MMINIVLPVLAKSGGADVVYKYTELLAEKGHDVIVYRPIWSFNYQRYSRKIVNRIHQLYCTLKNLTKIRHIEHKEDKFVPLISDRFIRNADVVIATSWPTSFSVNKLSGCKGKKVYFIQDFEIWDNEEYGLKSYELPLNKIVISTWINHQLKERLGIGPFPVIYNGMDTEKFTNPNKVYRQKGEAMHCLMLNHLLSKKGVDDGIKAFEIAKKEYPNMTLESFGLCDNGNLPDYVKYTQDPTQDELVEIYCHSDIFIFPSKTEGWGLTPLEAMACQCAVVGTRTGFVLDLGQHGVNMMISEPGDVEDLARNIVHLAKDRGLLKRISEQGRELTKKLSWQISYNKFVDILSDFSRQQVVIQKGENTENES